MNKLFIYLAAVMLILSSCGPQDSQEVKRLKAENDSLQTSKMQLQEEVDEYFATLYNVQQGIEKIKAAQNVIPVNPLSENTPPNIRNQVTNDVAFITELIANNQKELDNLRTKMKRSTFQLDNLEKTLASLTKQLNDEYAKVARLQAQLVQKDSVITQLGSTVDELGRNVEDLSQQNVAKQEVIQQQDEALHAAWYAIGSVKELRDNKIISQNGLFSAKKILQSDFNKNYFVKVDARTTTSIPLYSKGKAKLLTNHPRSSYKLEKENDSYVLIILKPTEFWSVSKYLVVEVD
ncbi:MAG TPA: hypothetical protein GXZ87_03685 [Bacteroidales bacterium]|nr:hypothetical protein [Bacteroidales bacterium]